MILTFTYDALARSLQGYRPIQTEALPSELGKYHRYKIYYQESAETLATAISNSLGIRLTTDVKTRCRSGSGLVSSTGWELFINGIYISVLTIGEQNRFHPVEAKTIVLIDSY